MFHEMSDLIPHKRAGRKILFPESAVEKVKEIRRLTKEEGLTYKMIKEDVKAVPKAEQNAKSVPDAVVAAQLMPRLSETVSRCVGVGFEGLREDLRLLAAQIDRQNDLLSRYLALQNGALEDMSSTVIEEEFRSMPHQGQEQDEEEMMPEAAEATIAADYMDEKTGSFKIKWVNFWAGRGWRA
jgi:DNA-binding transcriptional MerR regulator